MRLAWPVLVFPALALTAGCATRGVSPSGPAPPSAASAPPGELDTATREAFTQTSQRLFREAAPQATFTVTAPLQLLVGGPVPQAGSSISLTRPWQHCLDHLGTCESFLRDYVAKTAAIVLQTKQLVGRDEVVGAIRPAAYFDAFPPAARAKMLIDPLVGDLFVLYMQDLPQAARGLTVDDLEHLAITRGELAQLARKNLDARLGPGVESLPLTPEHPVASIQTGAFFEASRLLQTEPWAALSARTHAELLVAVPATDLILVALDLGPELTAKVRSAAERVYEKADRPLSRSLLRWTDHGWAVVAP